MQDEPAAPHPLTELEGAILSEIHHRGDQTAFKVRRSFASSPSLEWRGSAGAVYAAIARLEGRGLILGVRTGDKRASRRLSLTPQGVSALMAWACDPKIATSVGIDPFRLRSGIWAGLAPAARSHLLAQMREVIEADIQLLLTYSQNDDVIERTSLDLAVRLQQTRLDWLKAQQDRGPA